MVFGKAGLTVDETQMCLVAEICTASHAVQARTPPGREGETQKRTEREKNLHKIKWFLCFYSIFLFRVITCCNVLIISP